MADLVDSLLTLARADEGRFDLHREPIVLGPLVRDVYETAVILGEDAGLDVSMGPFTDEHEVVRVTIPQQSATESLNVAAAGAILLAEARRQRAVAADE